MPNQTVPLFGLGVGTKSSTVSAQQRVNMYVEQYQEPDKGPIAYFPRPGMLRWTGNNPNSIAGAWRGVSQSTYATTTGMGQIQDGRGFAAVNNQLCVITPSAVAITGVGGANYKTTVGPVRFSDNGFQIISVDGVSGLIWDYRNSTTPATQVDLSTLTNFPTGARTVTYLAGYFICDNPAVPGQFNWSNSQDGTTWQALNFANATASPDPLVGVFAARGQLLLLGTRTIEYWQPSGTSTVFQAVTSAVSMWGCLAYDTVRLAGDNVVMLARGAAGHGQPQVIVIQGYTPQVISTPEIDWDIANDPSPDAATAVVLTIAGHMFYVLNLTNKSWAYDFTNQTWNPWQTGDAGRFAGQYALQVAGQVYISDYRDSRVYNPSINIYMDDAVFSNTTPPNGAYIGSPQPRVITTRHLFNNNDWVTIDELVIEFEQGVGLEPGNTAILPQLLIGDASISSAAYNTVSAVNNEVMLQWSKDNGRTWGNEVWQIVGPVGTYRKRAVWRGLGRGRDWVFRFKMTDPSRMVVANAYARLR
jgi:hypothetical protein